MALTQEEFDALVGRLQAEAQAAPGPYQTKVVLLACLGYAYLFTVLLVLVGLTLVLGVLLVLGQAALLALKLGIPLLVLVVVVLRAMWVRIAPPVGVPLARSEAPRLFEAVDEIRAATRGPRTDTILVTDDFNAAVTQVPRLGLLGWPRNYLIVGMPLMQAFSPAQFKAVLCHEYGHLSREHARLSNWIYRMRLTWAKLMSALEEERHWGTFMFRRFVRWFVPYFNAYSFVLARANEYEADATSARLCGAEVAAAALTASAVKARYIHEFWTGVHRRAEHEPQPGYAPYTALPGSYATELAPEQAQAWLQSALREKTGTADTHPALADRLGALGQPPRLELQPAETAARYYLGAAYERLVTRFDEEWRRRIAPSWAERYEHSQETLRRLAEIEARAQAGTLTPAEIHDRAKWTEEFKSTEAALPLYLEVLAADADHAGARFAVGRIRLERGEPSGIQDIERAMALDAWCTVAGCQVIFQYLHEHGREDESARYRERAAQRWEQEEAARAERAVLESDDEYLGHGLAAAEIRKIAEQLERYPEIELAYLVRKDVEHFPEVPLYVLGYRHRRFKRGKAEIERVRQRLVQELELPGQAYIIPLHGSNGSTLQHIMRKIGSSVVYGED